MIGPSIICSQKIEYLAHWSRAVDRSDAAECSTDEFNSGARGCKLKQLDDTSGPHKKVF
jgi:hypothetical protein